MALFITIVVFIVIFSVLILIHELGHFVAAKRAGVKVEEFGFGLPPRLIGIKKGETIYSINWIPFGGFVRMLGEDTSSKESRSSERSFANQSLRTQAWIVVAGVAMNLILSFVLLTIGFWIGIEPLISTQEDFYAGIYEGTVNVEPGIVVVESDQSFKSGDRIVTDGEGEPIETVEAWDAMLEAVSAGGEAPLVQVDRADGTEGTEYLTGELIEQTAFMPTYLPRLVYLEQAGGLFSGRLENGDAIILVEGQEILTEADLFAALRGKDSVQLEIYRSKVGKVQILVPLPDSFPLITYVEVGAPAEAAGMQMGDQILGLNGDRVYSAEQVTEQTPLLAEAGPITYRIQREGKILDIEVQPRAEDGLIGVGLSDLLSYYGNLSLYQTYIPHTLMGFDTVQYGWSAPVVAVQEMGRLAKITAVMFVNVLHQFVTGNGVPEGVAGPVGIAQMTFVTMQDGFAAMLRFIALLSLSLGVVNILPIPALDGGKFFFIAVQVVTGKKLSSKYENIIHTAGFFFLILLIIYITFNDVLNLF
ncbi:MAG: site-2 protease family protein [Candidatus Gracilibacteria bacterium]